MTKKDSNAAGGGDFFSDISDALKSQMNNFSDEEKDAAQESGMSEEENTSLFSSGSGSYDGMEAPDNVFDSSSSTNALPAQDEQASTESEEQQTNPSQADAQELKGTDMAKDEAQSVTPETEEASSTETQSVEETATAPTQDLEATGSTSESNGAFSASSSGTVVEHNETPYTLHNILHEAKDRVVWRATCPRGDGQPPQPIHAVEMSLALYKDTYAQIPELPSNSVINKPIVLEQDDRALLFYTLPNGYKLAERIRDPQHHWTIQQLQKFMHNVGNSILALHNEGKLFLQLSDEMIWVQQDRSPTVHGIEEVYTSQTAYEYLPVFDGFSAPELYNRHGNVGPYTDVFAMGALLHYMISQCPSFNHLDLPNPTIPSLRIYQLDFPVGLDHVLIKACNAEPSLRFQSIPAFLNALDKSIAEIEERHRAPRNDLHLAVAHDIHIGISKGQRNPTNQDSLFWRYDKNHGKGLFIIADGVSHCHYGSGDRASSILIASAREHWNLLIQKDVFQKPISSGQRRRFIQSIFDTANAAISREVNRTYDRVDGYVEDVMGSTCVLAFMDSNEVTIANLGDSRSYLKTPEYIEQINVDHDFKTSQLQVGCDMRSIQNLMGASLITRCVGSCRKDENLKVVPLKLQPDFFELKLKPDDILLLCSDGLSDYAGNTEAESRETIGKILDVHTVPLSAVFWLVALANQRGGGDNISVIEIKVLDTVDRA